ncbi:coniferyl aldehyde dehydrogenase [Acinetobacter qingfengensis]|uniref:Aldehyde dehydrogenase n=1 Tax=Acinetobacter qingfengensis TaxID=1262585 RepID=A0A1E7RBX2_9GAMM|nr:coniferyl aldehyde dehydrogenase [Acinetobacter qingfengensis]KAA8734838.1 coniferyl aldehyde dehydrogenase [Acinetobacter qingfengensis]OEY96880.1 aldehyde dehydrogenase [Acinetobacter qingfengensis]
MSKSELNQIVEKLRQAHIQQGIPDIKIRHDRLERSKNLLLENKDALLDAINQDFGHRSAYQSLASDILASVSAINDAQNHLEKWIKSETVDNPFDGMKTEIQYQPLGVVGIISPWNFPLNLAFCPLASVFSAGNRALLKPSELTPKTSEILAKLVPQYFDDTELQVITGDAEVGAAFSALPFDHLIFTGSTNVGRHVMRAAAENLVPVTLELGGKSPVVITDDFDLNTAVERIFTIKTFNAGQICISPDYLLLPQTQETTFVEYAQSFTQSIFPSYFDNEDYTSIINERHFQRLLNLINDAQAKGANIITLNPEGIIADPVRHKIAPTLILNVHDDMLIMQEEIFGPLLPIKTYDSIDEAINYINARPRPLAAYYFSENTTAQQHFATNTTSGALVINDVMSHVFIENLPFGGVGASGIGAYHGIHGFRRFSHAKAVVIQNDSGESNLNMRAPYQEKLSAAQAIFN